MRLRRSRSDFAPFSELRHDLSRRLASTAKIRAILTDVHGLAYKTQIDGFRLWNLDELRLVKRGKKSGTGAGT